MNKKLDSGAALVAAVVALLGAKGLMTELGLTADQVAFGFGVVMVLAAIGRLLYEKWKDDHHLSLAEVIEVLGQLRAQVGALVVVPPSSPANSPPPVDDHEEILK